MPNVLPGTNGKSLRKRGGKSRNAAVGLRGKPGSPGKGSAPGQVKKRRVAVLARPRKR